MKKILLLCFFITAGVFAQADKVKFTAKIQNRNSDSLLIGSRKFRKTIKFDAKTNAFTDSFAIEPGMYQLYDGKEYTSLFLKNGYDLVMTMDAKQFDESIAYTGAGSKENNILAKKALDDEKFGEKAEASVSDATALDKLLAERSATYSTQLADPAIDPLFKSLVAQQINGEAGQLKQMAQQAAENQKLVGKASPTFEYENFKGGKTKLSDFKGKYVYIDVWATWCGPCRQEIPYLQKIEEKYKDKGIVFTSISVDVAKDYDKWKKMVDEKKLGGVQLIADKNWESEFMVSYGINSIPRFILLDPKGNIVDANAARPSDPELEKQLNALLK